MNNSFDSESLDDLAKHIIKLARTAYPELPAPKFLHRITENGDFKNCELRERITDLLTINLQREDHSLVRYLLQQELIECDLDQCSTYSSTILVRMICWFGDVEDISLLWQAKQVSFDMHSSVSSPYFFGAGIEETFTYLKENPNISPQKDILSYLIQEKKRLGSIINDIVAGVAEQYSQKD